jgi:hypothetical protein
LGAVCDRHAKNLGMASGLFDRRRMPELPPAPPEHVAISCAWSYHLPRFVKGGRVMILGMSLATFTTVHVIISLIAIVSGILVLFGILGSSRMPGLTAIFLLFTILTSATGFLFPFEKLLPSHMIGILSLVLLAIACIALYGMQLSGAWRWIYAVTAMISLYLNIFVLIIQGFLKVPALTALAPGNPPSGPVFAVVQGVVLLFFVLVIIGAIRRFRPMPTYA